MPEYSYNELRVLWCLKRHGGIMTDENPKQKKGIYDRLSNELDVSRPSLKYTLRMLEQKSLVLRTYRKVKASTFREKANSGYNPLVRLELVDPHMWLPELPKLSLGVVIAHENEDLGRRMEHEPSIEGALIAVLDRNDELQKQIEKLREIIDAQANECLQLKDKLARLERPARTHISTGLNQRVKDALTPEQWDALKHEK